MTGGSRARSSRYHPGQGMVTGQLARVTSGQSRLRGPRHRPEATRIRSRRLLPQFGHVPCLISKDPPPLDLGRVVDARWLPEQVSVPL
jgi:hypothetical protein